ncbi:MAG: TIGR02757 family protein [Flavobacteriales bacterium]
MFSGDIKQFLDEMTDRFERADFIEADPISIPHQFNLKEDIEISGFLSASIAWGQRATIVKNAGRMMQIMGNSPYDFVMDANPAQLERCSAFVHRTFNGSDFRGILLALRKIYSEDGGLEGVLTGEGTVFERIALLHRVFEMHLQERRTLKHISDPVSGSAAKRLNMFLRWMVRSNKRKVDFGIWKNSSAADLICPLDVHTGNVGRKLGLLHRSQNDWLAAEELTQSLREFDALDPVKYDFALFGLGVIDHF